MTAEKVAKEYGITREEQDAFALESQRRAACAMREGMFTDEIVPVEVPAEKRRRSWSRRTNIRGPTHPPTSSPR